MVTVKFQSRQVATLFVMGGLAVSLGACSSIGGTTYGTGESQELALLNDVSGMVGSQREKPRINYEARPGLVLPPSGVAPPAPVEKKRIASSVANNWPTDPDQLAKLYRERLEKMDDDERASLLAAIRKLPADQRNAIIKNDVRSTNFAGQIKEPNFSNGPVDPHELRAYDKAVKQRLALIRGSNDAHKGKRKYLTQPPEGYRELTPEVKREMERVAAEGVENEKKSSGVFSRLWPF